mgnify:CR=1 FL=1|nr:MAG TPA: hypothetical protein [Caudoviricetes sp.]
MCIFLRKPHITQSITTIESDYIIIISNNAFIFNSLKQKIIEYGGFYYGCN